MKKPIIIATRLSPLALAQTAQIRDRLCQLAGLGTDDVVLYEMTTKGDAILDKPLADIGGKGLFTDELNRALRAGDADIAVHSLKDLPTTDEEGLTIAAICARASPYDVLLSKSADKIKTLDDLKPESALGTSSLRRQAQILHHRPDISILPLRGNIGTRIEKLVQDDNMDAIILAAAGLERLASLSIPADITQTILPPEVLLPAAGQGALAVQCRSDDTAMKNLCAALVCAPTTACVTAERAALNGLDGSCRTPIAAFAQIKENMLYLSARLLAEDGQQMVEDTISGTPDKANALGKELALRLRETAPTLIKTY